MQLFIRDSAINKYMTSKFDSFCNIFLSEAPVPPATTPATTPAATTPAATTPATTNTQNANSTPPASAASQTDAMKKVMDSLVAAKDAKTVEDALKSHGFILTPANATNKPA